jgi:short subunit dehydrogenase-like uncharacterized protein
LARLLLRAGHEVLVAGRDPAPALAFVREHGGQPLLLDLREDLSPIARAAPGLVVDAAGPFQTYETNTYRVARFCIENGINYIDLSDDAGFAAGIAALDDMATRTGVFALSGASSVPTISAAAVAVVSAHPASGSAASWQRKREYDVGGLFYFDVGLYAPLRGGLIVRYRGCVTPDCEQAPETTAWLWE